MPAFPDPTKRLIGRCDGCAFFATIRAYGPGGPGICRHADLPPADGEGEPEDRANLIVDPRHSCEHFMTQSEARSRALAELGDIRDMWKESLSSYEIAWVLRLPECAVFNVLPRAREIAR